MAYFLPFRTSMCLRVFGLPLDPARFIEPNHSSLTLGRHLSVSPLCLPYLVGTASLMLSCPSASARFKDSISHSFHCVLIVAIQSGGHTPGFCYPFRVFIPDSWVAYSAPNTLGLSPSELSSSQVIGFNSSLRLSAPAVSQKTRYVSCYRFNGLFPLGKPYPFATSNPFTVQSGVFALLGL
jgi:hypothetical protein